MSINIIDLSEDELSQTTKLWEGGWFDAHGDIVPIELVALRTTDSFRQRLVAELGAARIAVNNGKVLGLCIVRDDELYQMYVSGEARGQGVAKDLLIDGEEKISAAGHKVAWLACAVGNLRAAKFYEKNGWKYSGVETVGMDTSDGAFPLEIWRFEKRLAD